MIRKIEVGNVFDNTQTSYKDINNTTFNVILFLYIHLKLHTILNP